MAVTGKIRNLFTRRDFPSAPSVSSSVMTANSLTIEQSRRENARVAQGLRRQDPGVLDGLIVQYQHRLLRYLLYLTGNRELAEDLFQETWMRVLVRGAQFKGEARFDTWLYTIARNLVIDVRRKRTMLSLEALCDNSEDDRPLDIPSADPTPFDNYRRSQDGQRVAQALLSLDTLHREVIVLRFHEELSLDEISKVTGSPLSTVKSRLYRGLAALKPHIEAAQQGEMAE